jgi:hypothetical protein
LFDHFAAGPVEPRINLFQFALILGLDAEMIEARLAATRRDGEIHPRVLKHPLGVIRFGDGGLRREQGRVEANRPLQIVDSDMDMKALHGILRF